MVWAEHTNVHVTSPIGEYSTRVARAVCRANYRPRLQHLHDYQVHQVFVADCAKKPLYTMFFVDLAACNFLDISLVALPFNSRKRGAWLDAMFFGGQSPEFMLK